MIFYLLLESTEHLHSEFDQVKYNEYITITRENKIGTELSFIVRNRSH